MAVIGTTELIIILVIVLVIFGGAKLPKLARSLGQAQREFRKNAGDEVEESASSGSADTKNSDA
ncbi:MAG: twin-arginine translocase TatA/TatE family subunit [bacterium]|nr:twin-arginine translocase TatA/TatE family subunit [bacterium]MXV90817.1 twin-arginine translocase TatA/TatE family subunit [Acidimicrobiia bacterium]MDE0196014.1 twin-arginine translocase TatA/TatE family subunit [bacterium]MYC44771.1 twin-arginine translocase TatA/TatE family subunit [Acidimicrobiia bacterium]MYI20055.1 twin-arginine translocase TatA/TatE family subunit [Acidimicrobiia bacterium]